ncbi:MAG: hypothetical protein RL497_1640 [Pseudomonadota bacterium]|jgi:hypothetical protein
MLVLGISAAIVLLCAGLGARSGLGAVARQITASLLALVLATYLAPLIAKALQSWLPFYLGWVLASLLVFMLVAFAVNKTLALFTQKIPLPRGVSLSGGAILMGGMGALGAGLLLWMVQWAASLQTMALSQPIPRAEGIYAWARDEVELLTRWSLMASGIEQPLAVTLGRVCAEPGFYMQQVASLAVSKEIKTFWEDTQVQALMPQQNDLAAAHLPSGQQLLQHPAAAQLLQALPFERAQAEIQLIKQVRQVWQVKNRLLMDAEIQIHLADGSLVEQLQRRDQLSLMLNPHGLPLLRRIQAVLLSEPESTDAPPSSNMK